MFEKLLKSTKINRYKQFFWDISINHFLSSYMIPLWFRRKILNLLGANIGKSSVHGNCYLGSSNLEIGDFSYVNRECLFSNEHNSKVKIGSKCAIGYRVSFYTINHEMKDREKRSGISISSDILIEDGCWIGANAVILPGITIGKGSVIAAGSVVTKNCSENAIYAGVPAIKIKDLS